MRDTGRALTCLYCMNVQVFTLPELQLVADLCLQHDVIALCDEVSSKDWAFTRLQLLPSFFEPIGPSSVLCVRKNVGEANEEGESDRMKRLSLYASLSLSPLGPGSCSALHAR